MADGVVGAGEAAAVAELGQDSGRRDGPDAVQALAQRPAAGLAGGEGAQLPIERDDLQVEHVDHPERDRDEFAPGRGELDAGERLAAGACARVDSGWDALVKELRGQPQLPGAALVDERLARPHPRAQLDDVRRRDPRLGQLPRQEQLQLQVAVGPVGLRAPLAPPLRGRLRRVGEMRDVPGPLDLLDHVPPAGRPLKRKLRLTAAEALQPLAQRLAVRRAEPATAHIAGGEVERLVRDLPAMNIQRAYDLHRDLLELQVLNDPRALARLCRGGPTTSHLWAFGFAGLGVSGLLREPSLCRRIEVWRPRPVMIVRAEPLGR